MDTKVAKFGGSSVADAAQIRKIADIINADGARRYVIVSAPGKRFEDDTKITDILYLVKTHLEQNAPYRQVWQLIKDRFLSMEQELGVDAGLAGELGRIETELDAEPSVDYLASRGEYLCAKLVAAVLGRDFVDAADVVLFDKKGRFLSEETDAAMREELAKHESAVIPGFYGAKEDGEIKTFTRGGSDITGAIVARAAGAGVYENWTDVSGFLMADPRIVDKPKGIKTISYLELRELSYMGASVLHENAIAPVRKAGIPINIRNTNDPEDPGTMIVSDTGDRKDLGVITGVAGKKDFTVVAIYKNMLSADPGVLRRILSVLDEYDVPIEHIPSGIDTISLVIPSSKLVDNLGDILDDLEKHVATDRIEVLEDLALIATVGAGMAARKGVAAKLFTALYESDVNIRMIDQGSSEMNIIVGVKNEDFEKAIRAIYRAFVE